MGGATLYTLYTLYTLCTRCTLYALCTLYTLYTLYILYTISTHNGKGKAPQSKRAKGKFAGPKRQKGKGWRQLLVGIPLGNQPARTHARMKRNDFLVGLTPQPPINDVKT